MVETASQQRRPPSARVGAALRGLALSCHPLPSLAVTGMTAGLVVQSGTTIGRGTLVTLAMFAGQLSIGWCNDAVDADRDRAVGRTDKPVAAGMLSRRVITVAAVLAVFTALALALPLGAAALAAITISMACGWAYDLGLKATAWSWLPYAVAFGLLPAIATFASADSRWPPGWALAAGALFGVAAHLANVLPDLLDDEATGVRGLPHRLGARASAVAGPLVLVAASAVMVLGPPGRNVVPRLIGVGVTVVVAIWAALAARRDPGSRRYFLAVIAIAMLDVLLFALSGAQL